MQCLFHTILVRIGGQYCIILYAKGMGINNQLIVEDRVSLEGEVECNVD